MATASAPRPAPHPPGGLLFPTASLPQHVSLCNQHLSCSVAFCPRGVAGGTQGGILRDSGRWDTSIAATAQGWGPRAEGQVQAQPSVHGSHSRCQGHPWGRAEAAGCDLTRLPPHPPPPSSWARRCLGARTVAAPRASQQLACTLHCSPHGSAPWFLFKLGPGRRAGGLGEAGAGMCAGPAARPAPASRRCLPPGLWEPGGHTCWRPGAEIGRQGAGTCMGRGEALHVRRARGHRLFPALPFTAAEGPGHSFHCSPSLSNSHERPGPLSTCTRVNLSFSFVRSLSCGRQEAGFFQEAGSWPPKLLQGWILVGVRLGTQAARHGLRGICGDWCQGFSDVCPEA